jgi:hypothetical protein
MRTTRELVDLALSHAASTTSPMKTSAELAAYDATWLLSEGASDVTVRYRAVTSLEYSLGVDEARLVSGETHEWRIPARWVVTS